ncbi:MAG: LysR substrate-binding domain-containing protein [Paludibacteraceae bacterium]
MFAFRLDVFHSVAKNLSFTKASQELHITQPAVTNHIKELETSLGISLFYRSQNSIILTEAGLLLFSYTGQAKENYTNLQYQLGILRNSFSGKINIGASTTIEQYVIPPILAHFQKKYPDIQLNLNNYNSKYVEYEVSKRSVDLGIIEGISNNREFKYIPFMEDEIVAVAHTSQPVAKKIQITREELKTTPMVVREIGSGSLDVTMSKLKEVDLSHKNLNIIAYLGSSESMKTFLANSNCISFISIFAVKNEIARGEFQIIDIDDLQITRTFHFIYPQGQQNELVNKFIYFCLDHKG